MKFKKERIYSAVNADELKPGDKVIVADDLATLKRCVKDNSPIDTLRRIGEEDDVFRFGVEDNTAIFTLAYLIERAENCTNCAGRITCIRQKPEHPELTKCCNYKRYECSEYKPKTEPKAEKAPAWFVKGLMDGSIERTSDEAEKHTDYNHCEEAMISACSEKKYRPFRDTDELIKVWNAKIGTPKWGTDGDLTMPLIWVRNKSNKKPWLINEFDKRILDYLFTNCEFLDGSPCGVEE